MRNPKFKVGQDVWFKESHNGQIRIRKGTVSTILVGCSFVDYTLTNGVFISEPCVFHSPTTPIMADLLQARLKQAEADYAIKCLAEKNKSKRLDVNHGTERL